MKIKLTSLLTSLWIVVLLVASILPEQHLAQTPGQSSSGPALTLEQVIDRFTQKEKELAQTLAAYSPMMETYLQQLDPHEELGAVPKSDRYFLGKLDLKKGLVQNSLLDAPGLSSKFFGAFTRFSSVRYLPNGFGQMMVVDSTNFDAKTYDFTYVRREFLGEVRCYVFDVEPKSDKKVAFKGRIWVEDQEFNIVRFNGSYTPSSASNLYFHFDSWRENMSMGLWLPAYIYTEESDLSYFFGRRKLRFKGQTRIWGYQTGRANRQNEFTTLRVESDEIRDDANSTEGPTPVEKLRAWQRQSEDNLLARLEDAGLLAPEGEVNKVLETVTNNLEITNNLNIQPGVRARVLLTSPIESFAIGHTIVVSRGLVDVLPDEASLAMVLAHELAHIALGHPIDTRYAFSDRMLFKDEDVLRRIAVQRDQKEETAADTKAAELLQNSPYKDKLENAGLFLRALEERAAQLPNLLQPHIGSFMAHDGKVRRMADIMKGAPALEMKRLEQIAALPLGGRVLVNPWNNTISLSKAKPVELLSAREKMPFEVTPVFLYLTRAKPPAGNAALKQ
jgi:hypothetical protein